MSNLLLVDRDVWLIGIRINWRKKWAALFVGRYGFVLLGAGADTKEMTSPNEQR